MSLLAKISTVARADFTVIDGAGNRVTGLLDGAFTKELFEEDGSTSAITVTVTELAGGSYRASFTPDAVGTWYLVISHPTHFPQGKGADFQVYANNLDGAELAGVLLDLANGVETSMTLRQALRLILASAAGEVSGAAGTTVTIKAPDDVTNRIVATVDSDGNRISVTRTP